MPRISALKPFLFDTAPWIILGLMTAACGVLLYPPPTALDSDGEYQTLFKQSLAKAEQVTEEYLTLNQHMFTLTEIYRVDAATHYETFYAEVLNTHALGGQLQVKNVLTDHRSTWKPYEENAELIARHQYATQPGAILNFQVLSAPNSEALCLYVYELSRLRCLNP